MLIPPTTRRAALKKGATLASLLCTAALVHADPGLPTGSIHVNRDYVRTGANSELEWCIEYPPVLPDLDVDEKGTVKVRILGMAYGLPKNNNGHGNNVDGMDSSNTGNKSGTDLSGDVDDEIWKSQSSLQNMPVRLFWSKNGTGLQELFYGDVKSVDPSEPLVEESVAPNDRLNFSAQGWKKAWTEVFGTADDSPNVLVLRKGDCLAEHSTAASLGLVCPYLKPYLDAGGCVQIGERDMLILWELDTTDPSLLDFDVQDFAILVTFQ